MEWIKFSIEYLIGLFALPWIVKLISAFVLSLFSITNAGAIMFILAGIHILITIALFFIRKPLAFGYLTFFVFFIVSFAFSSMQFFDMAKLQQ